MIALNSKVLKFNKFPNGETNVKLEHIEIDKQSTNKITLKYESDEDLIHLMFIKKHLDQSSIKTELLITYMPYSRMDRTEGHNVFTLKYISEFINSLNFEKVTVLEPHSDVTTALLNKCEAENTTIELLELLKFDIEFDENKDYIFFPDCGAEKRYSKNLISKNLLTGIKHRDFKTGFIKSLQVVGELPKEEFRVIIVDDLCSKGGTFILSASELKKLGAKEICLVVTHCEDTIFDGELLTSDLINKIYTTDSILSKTHEKIYLTKLV